MDVVFVGVCADLEPRPSVSNIAWLIAELISGLSFTLQRCGQRSLMKAVVAAGLVGNYSGSDDFIGPSRVPKFLLINQGTKLGIC